MMKKVLIIKNISHEDPGLILDVLNEKQIPFDVLDFSIKIERPNLENYELLIIMGGPDSGNDDSLKIQIELEIIKSAFNKSIPIFGICLGLQLMVKAVGGMIYRNPVEEIGFKHGNDWYEVILTDIGKKDPIFKDINKKFVVFQLHGETVELTEKIKLLGQGKYCKNQIIKIGNLNYGFQFHFEITTLLLKKWIDLAPELQNYRKEDILSNFETIEKDFIKRGRKIFTNYLELVL